MLILLGLKCLDSLASLIALELLNLVRMLVSGNPATAVLPYDMLVFYW